MLDLNINIKKLTKLYLSFGFILGVLSMTPTYSIAAPKALLNHIEQLDNNSLNSDKECYLYVDTVTSIINKYQFDIQLCFSQDIIYDLAFKNSSFIYKENKQKYSYQNINYLSLHDNYILTS